MQTYKNKSSYLNFSIFSRNYLRLLFLFLFLNGFAQIHITENTVVSFGKNTKIYSKNGFSESAKKEIAKKSKATQKVIQSDSLVWVVNIEDKKTKESNQLVVVKKEKETNSEKIKNRSAEKENPSFQLTYKPIQKSSGFSSPYSPSKIALLQSLFKIKTKQVSPKETSHFIVIHFPENHSKRFYLSEEPIIFSPHTENPITRPPPAQNSDVIS